MSRCLPADRTRAPKAAPLAPGARGLGRARGHDRRRRAGAHPVDDQHRHRGRHRHRDPGQGAGPRRLRAGAHHRQHARSRGAGALHPRAARSHGHRRAADRRLPLQRPPPAHRLSGLRAGAVQVPHQPRQRGQGRQARQAVRPDDRSGHALGQAGAHRRQLGQPRPGTAGAPDGREQRARRALGRQVGDVRGADHLRHRVRAAAPRRWAWTATRSSCRARSAACRT